MHSSVEEESAMWSRSFKPGDQIVYRKTKQTRRPGKRARGIRACVKGDNYTYFVDKFWVVRQIREGGELLVRTRRGKTHLISHRDPNLRHATLWQRLRYRSRFVRLQQAESLVRYGD